MDDYTVNLDLSERLIEDEYPTWLSRFNSEDTPTLRALFLGTMVDAIEASPEFPWKAELVDRLNRKRDRAHEAIRKSLQIDPQ